MNAEEAVDILNRHVAGAVTFHPLSTFSEIAALIRSQADDLKAIEGALSCLPYVQTMVEYDAKTLDGKNKYMVTVGDSEMNKCGVGITPAEAFRDAMKPWPRPDEPTTAPKAN